jgi:hypothetical protein
MGYKTSKDPVSSHPYAGSGTANELGSFSPTIVTVPVKGDGLSNPFAEVASIKISELLKIIPGRSGLDPSRMLNVSPMVKSKCAGMKSTRFTAAKSVAPLPGEKSGILSGTPSPRVSNSSSETVF